MKSRNLLGLIAINVGIMAFWQIENFWINLYWVRNIDSHAINVSIMVAISAIVGVATQIIFGALSDASKSRYGRRRSYILFGGVMGGICMCLFPLTKVFRDDIFLALFFAVLFDILITLFGDITTPTRLALLTELTEVNERGKYNALMAIAMGFGSGAIMFLYIFQLGTDDFYFYLGGFIFTFGAVICFIFIEDPPQLDNPRNFKQCLKEIFTVSSYKQNRDFYYLLFGAAWIAFGSSFYSPFMYIYAEKTLLLNQTQVGFISVSYVIFNFLIALPFAVISDKVGRKRIAISGIIMSNIFLFFTPLLHSDGVWWIYLVFGLITAFQGVFNMTGAAWVQDKCPVHMRSSMLAYLMVATVIPSAPGSLIGGYIADKYAIAPGVYSPIIFIIGALVTILILPLFIKINDSIKENCNILK